MKLVYPIVISLVILIIIYHLTKPKGIMVRSSLDGKYYTVKDDGNSQQSADTLAEINRRITLMINNLKNKPGYNRNLDRYSSIKQNIFEYDTAYTLNKKDTVFCLTVPGTDEIIDTNTLMYVAIHELAHIASDGVGHGEEFNDNFKFLLREAIDVGVYSFVEYSSSPIDYCGVNISRNVLTF